ncbi:MAG: helix-turn-helix domain-containing protein [Acidimicrobiia bacterium]
MRRLCATRRRLRHETCRGHLGRTTTPARRVTLADARREFEERYVRAALARCGGKGAAARELGVSRQGLRKLSTRLGLSDPGAPAGAH